jgi:hypothetical protein
MKANPSMIYEPGFAKTGLGAARRFGRGALHAALRTAARSGSLHESIILKFRISACVGPKHLGRIAHTASVEYEP